MTDDLYYAPMLRATGQKIEESELRQVEKTELDVYVEFGPKFNSANENKIYAALAEEFGFIPPYQTVGKRFNDGWRAAGIVMSMTNLRDANRVRICFGFLDDDDIERELNQ